MRYLFIIAVIVLAILGFNKFKTGSKPSIPEAEIAYRAYYEASLSNQCSAGSISISQITIIKIGDYSKPMGGWPLFVDASATCQDSFFTKKTINGNRAAAERNPACFIRRSATGKAECFLPEIFAQAQAQMQKAFNDFANSIPVR